MAKKIKRTAARSRKRTNSAKKVKATKKSRKKTVRKKGKRPSSSSNSSVASRKFKPARSGVPKKQFPASVTQAITPAYSNEILAEVRAFFKFHLGATPFNNDTILNPFFPGYTWTNLLVEFVQDLKYAMPTAQWHKPNSCIALAIFMTINPKYSQK